jgi:hypothetical protein
VWRIISHDGRALFLQVSLGISAGVLVELYISGTVKSRGTLLQGDVAED